MSVINLSLDEIKSMHERGVLNDYCVNNAILYKDMLFHLADKLAEVSYDNNIVLLEECIDELKDEVEQLEQELDDARNNPF